MSQEVAQAKSNELDIDDGTMPIEDAAQTEGTEETAQIDDDGDVDGSQVSEVETADDATTTDDGAETTTEETTEATDAAPKPEGAAAEAPKPDASAEEWKQYATTIREEFGETAAKPFEAMIAKMERQEKFIKLIEDERTNAETRRDQQVASQHMTVAGIDPKMQADVYQDAVDHFEKRRQRNRPVSGMDALKWAIRGAGGNPDKIDKSATPQTSNGATAKAEKLQGLRSIPPKSRQPAPDLNLDDPAVADGTAPARASR